MLTFARNRGELAEGWYDPAMKSKAEEALQDQEMWSGSPQPQATQAAKEDSPKRDTRPSETPGDDGSSEDEFGPALPKDLSRSRHGPVIPSLQDLELRDGNLFPPSPSTQFFSCVYEIADKT